VFNSLQKLSITVIGAIIAIILFKLGIFEKKLHKTGQFFNFNKGISSG